MLELVSVRKSFGTRTVVDGISARLVNGAALAVLGPSGTGKTTLLRIIAGLERLDEGQVLMDGQCVSSTTTQVPPELRCIGMVFQDFALWPHMRALKHLDFVLRGRESSARVRHDRARQMLLGLRIDHCEKSYPADMSGGEQQRLALARALITQPKLLLLDEPFSSLDSGLREFVVDELLARMRTAGACVVIATHDPQDIERLSATQLQLDSRK